MQQKTGLQVGYFGINDAEMRDLASNFVYIWAISTDGTMKKFASEDGTVVDSIAGLLSGGWGLTYSSGYLWASDPNTDMIYKIATVSGVEDGGEYVFEKFHLLQNSPNPFSTSTIIDYSIVSDGKIKKAGELTIESKHVVLQVYELTGRLIKTLVKGIQLPGNYSVCWDGTDEAGVRVTPGIYFYTLKAGNSGITKKMIIMR